MTREPLDEDRAANRVILGIWRKGLLKRESPMQFDCLRVMNTLDEFRDFLETSPSPDLLLERVASIFTDKRRKVQIVVRGPLTDSEHWGRPETKIAEIAPGEV